MYAIYDFFTRAIAFKIEQSIFYFHVNGSIGIVQKIDFEIRNRA